MKHTVKGFYTKEECIQIRESAKDFSKSHSVGIDGKPKIDGYRNAEIGSASPLRLPDIAKHVLEFNSKHYNMILSGDLQTAVNKYSEGQYFDTHIDIVFNDSMLEQEQVRKLSCAIQLSDPSDYEGGDLVVSGETMSRGMGDLHIFHTISNPFRYYINIVRSYSMKYM
jgi:predicted 2-oxoglutarate/Fe(II)-dependent dioxygenase YbiX